MAEWTGSSTYHLHACRIPSSVWVHAPGSRLLASGTMDGEMPWESCSSGIHHGTSVVAFEAASTMSLAWSKSVSKALAAFAACVGGTLGPGSGCCLGAVRNGHVGGYRAWGLGCSKRKVIVPSTGRVDMKSPWRYSLDSKIPRGLPHVSHIL
jgi:hypothetical protein